MTYLNTRTGLTGDLGPEALTFIPAAQSPNGKPLLVVGHEVSGTAAVYEIGLTLLTTQARPLTIRPMNPIVGWGLAVAGRGGRLVELRLAGCGDGRVGHRVLAAAAVQPRHAGDEERRHRAQGPGAAAR